jgi:hypothetical protein
MPALTDVRTSIREVGKEAPTILVDFAVIAVGDFATSFLLDKTRMDSFTKGLLATAIGIVGMVYAQKKDSRYVRDLTMGVGLYGVRQILETIIP